MNDEKFMDFLTDQFGGIHGDIKEIKTDLQGVKTDLQSVKTDLQAVKTDLQADIDSVRNQMVTKSFMTDKMINLKSDLIVMMRKRDEKLEKVVDKLGEKKIFNSKDIKEIKSMEASPVLR